MTRLDARIAVVAAIVVGQLYALTAALDAAFAGRSLQWVLAWQLLSFGSAIIVSWTPPRCRAKEPIGSAAARIASR